MNLETVRIRREGERVVLITDKGRVLDLPYQAAIEIGRHLMGQGRLAEEEVKAAFLIQEQTIINRLGLPLTISANPLILQEAAKQAPPLEGIASKSIVGVPTIIQRGI